MDHFFAEITFDFDDIYSEEKEKFIDHLIAENWINNNTERNWKVGYSKNMGDTELLEIITRDISLAAKLSKISKVDYAIILKESLFFGTTN